MHIALIISSLEAGGAERVMSTLANYWAGKGRDVTLITFASEAVDFYPLHPGVKRVALDLSADSQRQLTKAAKHNIQRLIRLRHVIQASNPDVVIGFGDTTNVSVLIATWGLSIPVIVSERVDPRHHPIDSPWGALRSLVYRHANALVIQSYALREWARGFVQDTAINVIHNPVTPILNGRECHLRHNGSLRTVVAMGRLTRQKGFDLLLRAFSQSAKKHTDWSLIILGEGEERRSLEALTFELGLRDRVYLPGLVQDPARILQGADLFVMASRYEGFPNALLEAMACGLAVISTDCPCGPGEIIRDGVDGILVPLDDVDALASAMDRLMADQAERGLLGARAAEVRERFNLEKIMHLWDNLLTHICQGRGIGSVK